MRRTFDEISDDEWDHHTFNPRLVLKKKSKPATPPPPIESFIYRPKSLPQNGAPSSSFPSAINIDDSDDSDFKREEIEEEEEMFKPSRPRRNVVRRRFVMEEDSDEHEVFDIRSTGGDGEEVNWSEIENEDEDDVNIEEEMLTTRKSEAQERDVDLVGRALQKCAKISAALRQELYGSAARDCDRYAEIDASSCRIITQEDVSAACASKESDFQPILKPYQIVGVNFLLLLHRKNIGGAILADEMGLGKTVQAVTYLKVLNHLHDDPGPHLIVCPASVLENWERELKKWCPSFSVIMYHGASRTTYSRELTSMSKAGLPPPFNVLLVCYSLFERHSEQQKEDRKALKRWRWSCVLMDEAHVLKDKNSYRWKNLMLVAQKAHQRLMLTGTPLQNDLHELWSLLEFMLPDIFATGDADLRKLFNAGDHDLILRIKSILGPFILRRMKSDVMQQLVPKIQNVKYVFMGSEQSDTYAHAVQEYRAACQARGMKSSKGVSSNLIGLLPKRQISNYFTQFRKIANHPLLIRRMYDDEDVVRIGRMLYPKGVFGFQCTLERAIEEIKSYNDFAIHRLLVSYGDTGTKGALSDEDVLSSAKCQALAELLPQLMNEGHRVLIFSQWTQMLDILEWTLEVVGVTYRRLDGSTQVAERQTIVDTFNNDQSIVACLLSTRAGGQGLNLIGADTVIIHDMDFNPQMDRQAEDRCHRIGQEKPVTIYRLVTKSTVDENIYEIAKRKLVLDAAVLESGGVELDNGNDVPERTMGEILSSLLLF